MPSVLVDYSFACDAYCTARWGEPSQEITGATCPRCAERKEKAAASNQARYRKHVEKSRETYGKTAVKNRKKRERLAIKERKEEERLYGHLLTGKE
jgi:hypothetical protein